MSAVQPSDGWSIAPLQVASPAVLTCADARAVLENAKQRVRPGLAADHQLQVQHVQGPDGGA
ncbi:MAG: hypothetical protein ACJA07_001953 [Rhodococcus sp. (in: high G+C Gram-positive bacteria)]|jgi:hypothetical protein